MNVNPGSNPNPPPNIAGGNPEQPAPGPQAAVASSPQPGGASSVGAAPTQAPPDQPPTPTGVRVLPQGAPVKPNGQNYIVPGSPEVNQSGIELLPGDADPNLLPPEMRNSPMFRYLQAQRVAQYKQATEEARWQNFVGAAGNIAQLATGQDASFSAGGARAKEPGQLDFGALHTLKEDADKAAASAKYQDLVAQLKRDNPDAPPSAIDAMAMDPKKVADYGYNKADAKAVADAAKANFEAQKSRNDLPGAGINDPSVIAESAKLLNQSEEYVRALPINKRLEVATEIAKARETSRGGAMATHNYKEIDDTKLENRTLAGQIARNAQTRAAIESGSGISGGGFTESEFEATARRLAAKFGITDWKRVTNDSVVVALTASTAMDLGQKLKGSFSDKDMALLARAAGGEKNMSAEEISRVLALSDLASRRAISENNERLTAAGQRVGEDRSKEITTPTKLSNAELREIPAQQLLEYVRNPDAAKANVAFTHGKATAAELADRVDDAIEARLYDFPAKQTKLEPGGYTNYVRTQHDKNTSDYLRNAPIERLEANRDSVIARLNALDPGNGEANYALILAAKRAGHFGAPKP